MIDWIKKDYWYIVALLIALAAILVMAYSGTNYQAKCNAAWQEQWDIQCPLAQPNQYDVPYNMIGDLNGMQSDNNNPTG